MKTNFQRTADWLATCGKVPGDVPTIAVQTGVHIEEFSEFLECLSISTSTGLSAAILQEANMVLRNVATILKTGEARVDFYDRENTLKELCDCEVTGNGLAFLLGMQKAEADQQVMTSNESKLNADGTPVILPGGKIGKGPNYFKPNLTPFV